jgi:hypothetical protein
MSPAELSRGLVRYIDVAAHGDPKNQPVSGNECMASPSAHSVSAARSGVRQVAAGGTGVPAVSEPGQLGEGRHDPFLA